MTPSDTIFQGVFRWESLGSVSASRLLDNCWPQEGGNTEEEIMTADIREEFEQLKEEIGELWEGLNATTWAGSEGVTTQKGAIILGFWQLMKYETGDSGSFFER